jgi:hypothetical protein
MLPSDTIGRSRFQGSCRVFRSPAVSGLSVLQRGDPAFRSENARGSDHLQLVPNNIDARPSRASRKGGRQSAGARVTVLPFCISCPAPILFKLRDLYRLSDRDRPRGLSSVRKPPPDLADHARRTTDPYHPGRIFVTSLAPQAAQFFDAVHSNVARRKTNLSA